MERIIRDLIALGFTEEQANKAYKSHSEKNKLNDLIEYIAAKEFLVAIL